MEDLVRHTLMGGVSADASFLSCIHVTVSSRELQLKLRSSHVLVQTHEISSRYDRKKEIAHRRVVKALRQTCLNELC